MEDGRRRSAVAIGVWSCTEVVVVMVVARGVWSLLGVPPTLLLSSSCSARMTSGKLWYDDLSLSDLSRTDFALLSVALLPCHVAPALDTVLMLPSLVGASVCWGGGGGGGGPSCSVERLVFSLNDGSLGPLTRRRLAGSCSCTAVLVAEDVVRWQD